MFSVPIVCLGRGLVVFALLLVGIPTLPAAESSRPATVSGVVSNQATGDLLAGALVVVEGTNTVATTERGGGYSLSLPEGTHTLLISFPASTPPAFP